MAAALARQRIEQALGALPPKVQKFITSHIRKGENFELKAELNSEYRDRRKEAVKRVIMNMTVGKDVSGLFADVLKCMQTDDLELKKLVYLYLMNYAKTQPELVILAVNSFVKDVDDPNPLIRALAVRTMGCLRAERIVDYLMEPLRKTLKDQDPYVRKTAAICVAKMYDLKPVLTVENGFVASLQDLLSDANPMVVANAVAALKEIQENPRTKETVFAVNAVILQKLLAALNECTEWGQIFILESLAEYVPADHHEANNIVERVMPRLSHVNGSVVLAAIRVLLVYLEHLKTSPGYEELAATVAKKMSPPLVTLLASTPEMTYVALRNIKIILQRRPNVLSQEIRVFFCKYNDPQYVKIEKLDVMMRLTTEKNVDSVLVELKEYANEVDVTFVRKAIRAMGTCAIKIEAAADRCVAALLDLIKTRVSHVTQEAMVVLRDIFRKYPNRYEAVIPVLCEQAEDFDEEEARAALVWVIGEHAGRITNAPAMLQMFVDSWRDEGPAVQLALVTSGVKCFLQKPETQPMVQAILQLATKSDLPDLRDRAFVYWRLLSSGADVRAVAGPGTCPPIVYESDTELSPGLLDELVKHLGSLAAAWHKPVKQVLPTISDIAADDEEDDGLGDVQSPAVGANASVPGSANLGAPQNIPNLLDLDFDDSTTSPAAAPAGGAAAPPMVSPPTALLDLLAGSPPLVATTATAPAPLPALGLTSISPPAPGSPHSPQTAGAQFSVQGPRVQLLAADQGQVQGLEIHGTFGVNPVSGAKQWLLELRNATAAPMSDFAIQLNKNTLGLAPGAPLASLTGAAIAPGTSVSAYLPLTAQPDMVQAMVPPSLLQAAIKCTLGIVYFAGNVPDAWLAGGAVSPPAPANGGLLF